MKILKLTSILILILFYGTSFSQQNDSDVVTNKDNTLIGTYGKRNTTLIVHDYDENEMIATISGTYFLLKKSESNNKFKYDNITLEFFLDESKVIISTAGNPFTVPLYKQSSSKKITPSPDVKKVVKNNDKAETTTVKKTYYDNGQLSQEISKKGKLWVGPYKSWDKQGNLIEKTTYYAGGDADVKYFYTDGTLQSKGKTYWDKYKKDDIKTGLWQFYYKNGQLKEENKFKDGKLIKLVNRFLEDGKQTIKNGTGYYIDLYKNGKEECSITMINGVRNGLATWYFKNGNIQQQALYAPRGNDYQGLRMEIIQVNDINDEPLDKGTLKNGNGTWKSYDANGKLTEVNTYKNGIIVE